MAFLLVKPYTLKGKKLGKRYEISVLLLGTHGNLGNTLRTSLETTGNKKLVASEYMLSLLIGCMKRFFLELFDTIFSLG